jgi:hypothetical protein
LYDKSRYEFSPKNIGLEDIGKFLSDRIRSLKMILNDFIMLAVNFKQFRKEYKEKANLLKQVCEELSKCNLSILSNPVYSQKFKKEEKVIQILYELK